MADIGSIGVNIVAKTGGLKKGMADASKSVKSVGPAAKVGAKAIAGIGAAIAAVAAAAVAAKKVFTEVSEAFVRMDAAAKTARSIDMAAQSFMGLQHAASLAGVEGEQMTGGLSKMLKGIGEASMNVGQAKIALQELGIPLLEMTQMTTEQKFLKISEALNKVDDPAKRAALAVMFFGRTGLKLLPMIEQGSEAIKQQAAELEKLQGPLTDLDFANVEEGNDAANRFGMTIEGVFNQLAAAIAPAKIELYDFFTELGSTFANFVADNKEGITGFFMGLVDATKMVVNAVMRLVKTFMDIKAKFDSVSKTVQDFTEKWTGLRIGITELFNPMSWLRAAWGKITGADEADKLSEQIDKWNQKIADQKKAVDDLDKGLRRIQGAAIVELPPVDNAVLSYEQLVEKAEELKVKNGEAIAEAERLTATLREQIRLGDQAKMTKEEQEALQKRINQLEMDANASNQEHLETTKKITKEKEKLQKRADKLLEGTKTQADKYREQLAEIQELRDAGVLSAEDAQKLTLQVEAKIQSDIDKVVKANVAAGTKLLGEYQKAMNKETEFLPAIIKGSVESMQLKAKQDWQKRNPVAKWAEKNNKVGWKNNSELKAINKNLKALKPSAGGSGSGGGGGGGIQINEVNF